MHKAESLRGQDVLVACKLFSAMVGKVDWSFPSLSAELDVSVGEIYNSVGRCRRAQLLVQGDRVSRPHLRELLVSAVPRIFYATRGAMGVGVPTSTWAPPLASLMGDRTGTPLVWASDAKHRPDPSRSSIGETIEPVYPSVPRAALRDLAVYELLALVDVVRVGDASSRKTAVGLIERRVFGR